MSTEKYFMDDELKKYLTRIMRNPGDVIEFSYRLLAANTDGKINVPSPSNPFSYLLECSAMQASTLFNAQETIHRRQYPKLATRYADLYNHMFDKDYIGRFATPGKALFDIAFKKNELLRVLEEVPGEVKKITLPRGTTVLVNDYTFTLLHSIDIIKLRNNGIRILYRTEVKDPISPLSSNIVDFDEIIGPEGHSYIRLKVWLYNLKISQRSDTTEQANGFSATYDLKDKFCHCRVYHTNDSGRLTEIHTTHSDIVYDATVPTARLIYLGDKLKVVIPQIYYNNNKIGKKVLVEIYTTKGNVDETLDVYSPDSFSYKIGALENVDQDTTYVLPIGDLSHPVIFAQSALRGGTDGEDFDTVRDRVINFANYVEVPITAAQLSTVMNVNGYDVVKTRDTLTSRTYHATRSMPINKANKKIIGSSMETIKTSITDLEGSYGVRHNKHRFTITPESLFKYTTQGVAMVKENDLPNVNGNSDEFLRKINNLEYLYTPFYYLVDTFEGLSIRPYYLDDPSVENLIFVDNNITSGLSVSSDDVVISKYKDEDSEGYVVRVKTRSVDEYKDIPTNKLFCQMALIPHGDTGYAYINGKLLGSIDNIDEELTEYIWEFKLETNWDMPDDKSIIINNLKMYLDEYRSLPISLSGELHFIYGVMDTIVPDYKQNGVDTMINKEIIHDDYLVAITHDKVDYKIGDFLGNLWTNSAYVRVAPEYERYATDIPRRYTRDVYEIDEEGAFILENDDLVILHNEGDVIEDENGEPILYARKGDVKLDKKGMPIIKANNHLRMLLDIFMLDGVYKYATTRIDTEYRDYVAKQVRNYAVDDLTDIKGRLLENTDLYFSPKATIGNRLMVIDNGAEVSQPMRLSFDITYYITGVGYRSNQLRSSIEKSTSEVLNMLLKRRTLSLSDITIALQNLDKENIVGVDVGEFNRALKYTTYTMKDESSRCSIKQVLKRQADLTYKVVEDINVNFILHDK